VNLPADIQGLARAAGLPARPLHLAVGIFDGVHLGHRSVVDAASAAAAADGGLAGVLTFWPHPSRLFRPQDPVKLIQTAEIKARHLLAAGAAFVVSEPFTPEFAAIEAEEFLPHVRRSLPTLAALYIGENWRFGRGRRGDLALLRSEGRIHGIAVVSAPRINLAGEPISSTRIRAALASGRIEEANALLGYAYYAEGKITPGKQLGRTIGFPTLNVPWQPDLRPAYGVYAVKVRGSRTTATLSGVANYGVRPTVEQSPEPRLEVHVLGDCVIGAGDSVTVEWLHFLRSEMKFAGLAELQAQIDRDRAQAATVLGV
jgi:riboflavin kinase/FMN adenylyltransferase